MSNILLQVLDEGRLTDSQGRKIDFRNTFIIMTSNLGAEALASLPEGVPSSDARDSVMAVVKSQFPPEFLNRIDDIILFNRLSPKLMHRIVDIQVKSKFNSGSPSKTSTADLTLLFQNLRTLCSRRRLYLMCQLKHVIG